jgi:hypothetical protein
MRGQSLPLILVVSLFPAFEARTTSYFSMHHRINCTYNEQYIPSTTESIWAQNIDRWSIKWGKTGCKIMKSMIPEVNQWLNMWDRREQWIETQDLGEEESRKAFNKTVMSYYLVTQTCGARVIKREVPIEPLMSFMRHPMLFCINYTKSYFVLNKDYMFPVFIHETFPIERRKPSSRKWFLFDLGASLYTSGAGGASQKWFVDTYRARGIEFDRILAWEARTHPPEKVFKEYPPDIYGRVSYYNVPAETAENATGNPLRILMQLAQPTDFVVLKIDIDNDEVELKFISQILENRKISALIDELYFEHHTTNSPMDQLYWGSSKKAMNITESYAVFGQLRRLGIRAHPWV